MKLGRKNLIYSLALAGIMLALLAGYFCWMLPSLYVDHVMEQNLESIREQHRAYVETGSYQGVRVKNVTACFSMEIPDEGNLIRVTGKTFSAEILLRERRLQEILQRCRDILNDSLAGVGWKDSDRQELDREVEELWEVLESLLQETQLPVEIRLLYTQELEQEYKNETAKLHIYTDSMLILEAGIEDSENHYVNYMAMEKTSDSLVISLLPVVTPEIQEIRPVVLMSLPMLGAVIFLLVLLFSRIYSRGIVSPIVELVRHTEQMKYSRDFSVKRMWEGQEHRRDEVGELADTLDDLYGRIRESYSQLEVKNAQLAEENQRQEVFLRASSHQLKTPIAAALLLVDGMIHQIGRYKDTRANLPRVKEQLLSMKKMVEDILFLGHCTEHMHLQVIDVGTLVKNRLETLAALAADRKLRIELEGEEGLEICTDETLFTQILDNLLSNAVKYTPREGRIAVCLIQDGQRAGVRITNFGVWISQELLPHIFEPFVSGNAGAGSSFGGCGPEADRPGSDMESSGFGGGSQSGSLGVGSHGLGLYIADYYAKKLHADLSVRNVEEGVETEILQTIFTASSSEIHTDLID